MLRAPVDRFDVDGVHAIVRRLVDLEQRLVRCVMPALLTTMSRRPKRPDGSRPCAGSRRLWTRRRWPRGRARRSRPPPARRGRGRCRRPAPWRPPRRVASRSPPKPRSAPVTIATLSCSRMTVAPLRRCRYKRWQRTGSSARGALPRGIAPGARRDAAGTGDAAQRSERVRHSSKEGAAMPSPAPPARLVAAAGHGPSPSPSRS